MLYIALIHYPVLNKHGEIVTTSITNFDLHDLARTTKTYNVNGCFIITPIEAQRNMAAYIQDYWQEGFGSEYNPDRRQAFKHLVIHKDIHETCLTIKKIHGTPPRLVATTARKVEKAISYNELKGSFQEPDKPTLILFGTGWGLAPEVMNQVECVLEPICGPGDYNHLPVRAAVAIVLDRLLGK